MNSEIIQILSDASNFLKDKKWQQVNETYQNAILKFPDQHEIYHAFGIALIQQNNPKQAIEKFLHAIKLDPDNAIYHSDTGEMYRRLNILDQSIKYNSKAVELNPHSDTTNYNLGLSHYTNNNFEDSILHFNKAIELNPNHSFAWNNLGSAYEKLENLKLAHESYQKAVDLNPNNLEALNNLATTHTQFNNVNEAIKIFNNAINIYPHFFEAHFNLSSLKKYTKQDPHLNLLEEVPKFKKQFNTFEAVRYHFAYGKALDDIGEYNKAFFQYNLGNQLQNKLTPYDQIENDEITMKTTEVFNINFINKFKSEISIKNDRIPIFIVGMPRSGTTLIEQMLDSHSNIFGAGELKTFLDCINFETSNQNTDNSLNFISKSEQSFFRNIGSNYLNKVWKLSPKSSFISDKMPGNFFNLGLIYLALPNAKVIHSMRDPMDTCFSNYIRLFKDDMRFTYSQNAIGNYYKNYQKLMEHWKKVLPKNFIFHLKYEDMIKDTENQAKKLTEFLGLEWDPNCLNFYNNKRNVKTASMMQVRKPIYKSSISRWKNFSINLSPLIGITKDLRDQYYKD